MNTPERASALQAVASIPRDADGPVFPAPWAARAFAMAVALNERGLFTWSEWAETLGANIRDEADAGDADVYWRAWLSALETILLRTQLADRGELLSLQEAWRRAAKRTPHGEPVELRLGNQAESDPAKSTAPSTVMKSAAATSSPSMT